MTLKEALIKYFNDEYRVDPERFTHKGNLELLAKSAAFNDRVYLAETVNRQLRLLTEEKILEVKPIGKSVQYRLNKESYKPKRVYKEINLPDGTFKVIEKVI